MNAAERSQGRQPPPRRPQSTHAHSPSDWDQVEDPAAVAAILEQLRQLPRCDAYASAEDYELAYPGYDGDAAYYVERTRRGRVLYLGVGTGRIFLQIATVNPHALGIEQSPVMLGLLAKRHPQVAAHHVLLADAATIGLPPDAFDTVVAPFSFLQVLDEAALLRVLGNVARWLKPGGHFHTDVFSPYLIPFRKKGLETSVRAACPDTQIAIFVRYDHARQTMQELAVIDSPCGRRVLEMHLRYYFPLQLAARYREAGLPEPTIVGGYRGEPFDPSENSVLVLETRKPIVPRTDTAIAGADLVGPAPRGV